MDSPGMATLVPLLKSPLFGLSLTFGVYYLAQRLYWRTKAFIFNPVLVSIVAIICILKLIGIEYKTYFAGAKLISFFLGPAVVALGVLLYEQLEEIARRGPAIIVGAVAGAAAGIVSAAGLGMWLGAEPQVINSLAPKSVTTPIAMGIAARLGGIESLTAAVVIATGVLGAVLGPGFLRLIRVKDPTAFGLAMGAASHGIGTARALEEGPLQGATGGLAICLCGLATALMAPLIMKLLWWLGG